VYLTKAQEIDQLQGQASLLQDELNQINARLQELSADTETE
jgi:prefoldin subunit 5